MGLRRVISRTFEADCDRRAARAVGFPQTIAALYKVHAAHQVRNRGGLSLLAYAVATHPSREVRLSLLIRAARRETRLAGLHVAPQQGDESGLAETGGVPFVYSATRFWRHRIMSCAALIAWALALVMCWRAVGEDMVLPLLFLIATPSALLLTAVRPEERRRAQRGRVRGARSWVDRFKLFAVCWAVAIFVVLVVAIAEIDKLPLQIGILLCMATGAVCWVNMFRRSPRRQLVRAIAEQDFAAALRIGESHPKLRKDPSMRYNLALMELIEGDHERGLAELEQITASYPKFRLPPIVLSMALVDSGRAERAWQVASAAARLTPKDPLPHAEAARALRSLGRHEECRAAAQRALDLDADCVLAEALLGGVALDTGMPEEARRRVARALDLSPGNAFVLALAAEN